MVIQQGRRARHSDSAVRTAFSPCIGYRSSGRFTETCKLPLSDKAKGIFNDMQAYLAN